MLLTQDGDSEIRGTAEVTLAQIPSDSLAAFLGRSDVSDALRDFFRARGIEPDPAAASTADDPLIDIDPGESEAQEGEGDGARKGAGERLAILSVRDRMRAAMKGTKEERAILVRDPNKLVSVSVLSSQKLSESEVESFSKMANVSEEVLGIIGTNRNWLKNYGVIAWLARNPKTPLVISMRFVQRLTDRDLKLIVMDRNIQEPSKPAVRKRLSSGNAKG